MSTPGAGISTLKIMDKKVNLSVVITQLLNVFSEGTKEQPVNEPIPMTATVKTEFAEPTVGEMNVPPGGISDTMGYVCYYVRAAFEALFGATGNLQDQVAAISALPPNWGQPTGVSAQNMHALSHLFSMSCGFPYFEKTL